MQLENEQTEKNDYMFESSERCQLISITAKCKRCLEHSAIGNGSLGFWLKSKPKLAVSNEKKYTKNISASEQKMARLFFNFPRN